jgi:iron complex transport system ATP-binding protein
MIGPNGSGKTSLLKAIAGMVKPLQGNIKVLGRDLQKYSRRLLARKIALVPQDTQQGNVFSVLETVLMGRTPHSSLIGFEKKHDLKIAEKCMQDTGVLDLAMRRLDQLSGGERQRAFIARALCQEPEIILLDEPTSALDLAHQVKVMDLLEKLQKEQGIAVVMAAHDLNLASLYAQRILLMQQGRIVKLGPPSEVLSFDNLEKVFGCILLVDRSPLEGLPMISVIPGRYLDQGIVQRFSKQVST